MFLVFTQVWEAEHMVSVSTHLNPKFCNSDVPISKFCNSWTRISNGLFLMLLSCAVRIIVLATVYGRYSDTDDPQLAH